MKKLCLLLAVLCTISAFASEGVNTTLAGKSAHNLRKLLIEAGSDDANVVDFYCSEYRYEDEENSYGCMSLFDKKSGEYLHVSEEQAQALYEATHGILDSERYRGDDEVSAVADSIDCSQSTETASICTITRDDSND